MTGIHPQDLAARHLGPMPREFWRLCDQILKAWQQLNCILDRERQILLSRDLGSLWTIIGSKDALAERIQCLESDLDSLARRILTNQGTSGTPSTVALGQILHPGEADRFIRWKTRLELARAQAQRTNKATLEWITQEMDLGRQLIGILCGRGHAIDITYTRPGDNGRGDSARMKARQDIPGANAPCGVDFLRQGVSSYRANQLHGKRDGDI